MEQNKTKPEDMTELANAVHCLAKAFDRSNMTKFADVVDAIEREHSDERCHEAEYLSAVVRFDLETLWMEVVKRYFPDAVNNLRYRRALAHWEDVYRCVGHLVEDVNETSACCMDAGRFIANAYVRYTLDDTLPDMSISEKNYWTPRFGAAKQWMEYCRGVVKCFAGHDASMLMDAERALRDAAKRQKETAKCE